MSAYSTPTGVSLKDSPEVRSLYQQAMGKQNLDKQLTELAKQPKVIDHSDRWKLIVMLVGTV